MSESDLALQWLDFLGTQVYNKQEQILVYHNDPKYKIAPLDTKIKVGIDLDLETDEEVKFLPFDEFDRMGYAIRSTMDIIPWLPRQKFGYEVMLKTRNSTGITYKAFISAGIKIEHDAPNKRFRLVGEAVIADPHLNKNAAVGPWIIYDDDAPRVITKRKLKPMTREELRLSMQMRKFGTRSEDAEYVQINEIPQLITEDKYIVCMPRNDSCQRIIVVGGSRMGKSVYTHATYDHIFYKWGERVGLLIDPMDQFYNMSLPQNHGDFIKMLSWIGEEPRPVPAVQLYVGNNDLNEIPNPNISLILTLSIRELLNKYKLYSYGIDDWVIKGSTRYLYQYIEDIKDCKDGKEFYAKMEELMPSLAATGKNQDKNLKSMVMKWSSTFDTICKERFTSNMYKDSKISTDELTIITRDGIKMTAHPFIALMEAGVIPVINIATCRYKKWIRNYVADVISKIYQHQMKMGKNKNRIWIIADELNEIYEKGKYNDFASQNFEMMYRQGAMNGIGFIGNSQSLTKLNPEMYNNATHICCCYMKDKKDRKKVLDTFGLWSPDMDEMLRTLKPLEMVIFTKEPMVVYDRWGRRRVVKDRLWWKGRIIPPVSYHMPPPK